MAWKRGVFWIAWLAMAGAAHGQGSDPAWLEDLTFQLRLEKKCEVIYVMNLREGTLGAQATYEARVQCEDGRMFDANRIGENVDFTFTPCETQVC